MTRLHDQSERLNLWNTECDGVDCANRFAEQPRGSNSDVAVISERQVNAGEPEALPQRTFHRSQQACGKLRVEDVEGFLPDGDVAVLRQCDVWNRLERSQRGYVSWLLSREHRLTAERYPAEEPAERRD